MNFEHCFQVTISYLNWKIQHQIRRSSCEISDFKIRFNLNFTAKRVEPQQLGPAEQLKRRQALSTIVSTIGLLKIQKLHSHYLPGEKSQNCRSLQSEAAFSSLLTLTRQPLSTIVSTIGISKLKKLKPFFYHLKNESCHQNKKGAWKHCYHFLIS